MALRAGARSEMSPKPNPAAVFSPAAGVVAGEAGAPARMALAVVPGSRWGGAAKTVAPFVSELAAGPLVVRDRVSEKPWWVKPPAATACQAVPGLAITGAAVTVAPFISQI